MGAPPPIAGWDQCSLCSIECVLSDQCAFPQPFFFITLLLTPCFLVMYPAKNLNIETTSSLPSIVPDATLETYNQVPSLKHQKAPPVASFRHTATAVPALFQSTLCFQTQGSSSCAPGPVTTQHQQGPSFDCPPVVKPLHVPLFWMGPTILVQFLLLKTLRPSFQTSTLLPVLLL